MKSIVLAILGTIFSVGAYAAESKMNRKIASEPAVYEVTDVICRSGAKVNFKETVTPGYSSTSDGSDYSIVTTAIRKEIKDAPHLQKLLNDDAEKMILFVSTCDKDIAYKSGRGPCPEKDQVIVLGKVKK